MNNISSEWFQREFSLILQNYNVDCKFFSTGDFGSLKQINFNSESKGGNIDFWGLGWLGVFLWDYKQEVELLNILLDPKQQKEQQEVFDKLKDLL